MQLKTPLIRWPDRIAPVNAAQVCMRLSRLLLLLVTLELLSMPVTQLLWTWDGFLHGGQDFELGLFVIVSCLCLVLLRAQHGRQKVRLLLAVCRFRLGTLIGSALFRLLRESLFPRAAFSSQVESLRPSTLLRI